MKFKKILKTQEPKKRLTFNARMVNAKTKPVSVAIDGS